MHGYDSATALVVVDLQNDFADPAGSLSVAGGHSIVPIVNVESRLLFAAKLSGLIVLTNVIGVAIYMRAGRAGGAGGAG